MIKQFWLNLPVKDVARSKAFFKQLGFQFNPNYPESTGSASMFVGQQNTVVMLFDEKSFKGFSGQDIADTAKATEVLLSFDAESKEEVDELARKAVEAGGKSSHTPSEMAGWMYGCVFTDPDGHRWNILYMDSSKMPK